VRYETAFQDDESALTPTLHLHSDMLNGFSF
jgi:hypothetical protein